MTDHLTPEERSRNMSRIRSRDTGPEKAVRSLLHGLGFRFRLHRSDLPGTPDIVLPKYRTIVFVHGCFWHQHPGCRYATMPSTRRKWWAEKFLKNRKRDATVREELRKKGWNVLVVWQCELREPRKLRERLIREIRGTRARYSVGRGVQTLQAAEKAEADATYQVNRSVSTRKEKPSG